MNTSTAQHRVLIVDDDRDLCELLGAALNGRGYEWHAAQDLASAREAIEREYFPLVLLDRHLPDGDGVELLAPLRAQTNRPYTVVAIITSRGEVESYIECLDAGADDFLPKPLDLNVLVARLRGYERILSLQGEVGQLRAYLPICMYCHKVRDEAGRWDTVEEYVRRRSAAHFSHGICESCFDQAMPDKPGPARG